MRAHNRPLRSSGHTAVWCSTERGAGDPPATGDTMAGTVSIRARGRRAFAGPGMNRRASEHRGGRPIRTVASFIFISLDGFHEGPDGELDWPNVDAEFHAFAARQLDEADAIGFGRATYEHMAAFWPTDQAMANDPHMTSRMNDKEKLVFSRTLTDAEWSGSTVVRGEAVEHVAELKAAPGGELLVIGSAHLTADLARAGLLDELRIMIFPIVLGRGRSLFEDLGSRLKLELLRVRRFDSGNLLLTYRPSPTF